MASGDWCIWRPGDSRIRNNVLNSQGRRDITGETRYAWLGYPKRVNLLHEREDSFSARHLRS